MKAAHAAVGGAPCRKSGYVGRKRWAQPNDRFVEPSSKSRVREKDITPDTSARATTFSSYFRPLGRRDVQSMCTHVSQTFNHVKAQCTHRKSYWHYRMRLPRLTIRAQLFFILSVKEIVAL
jgi:hypothetical protein